MPVTIVIPTWGERDALEALLPELRNYLPHDNILVVWDGPDDGTQALCLMRGAMVMKGPGKGLGAAIIRGIRCAPDDLVVVMDGDGQHPALAAKVLAERLAQGDPFVAGLRIHSIHWDWGRVMMSKICALAARPLCNLGDPMTGLFGLDRRTVDLAAINPNTWKIGLELATRGEYKTPEQIQYIFYPRTTGKSHAGWQPALQFAIQLARLYAWKIDLLQMLRFGVVGSSGILVNMTVTVSLVEWLGQDYRWAAIAGIGVAMIWNYFWNKFWTFGKRKHIATAGQETLARK